MNLLAIDPGTTESGWAQIVRGKVLQSGVCPNDEMLRFVQAIECDALAIEMIASYGMAVGKEVFETVRWIGRYQQAWRDPEAVMLIYRKDVKQHICHNTKAKDANIRAALIDLLGPQGTKRNPGPTYGVKSHAWAALAVGVTALKLAA